MLGMGKSDPYVVLSVGAQSFKSKVITNTVTPKWDFHCEVRSNRKYLLISSNQFYILFLFTFYTEDKIFLCQRFHKFLKNWTDVNND